MLRPRVQDNESNHKSPRHALFSACSGTCVSTQSRIVQLFLKMTSKRIQLPQNYVSLRPLVAACEILEKARAEAGSAIEPDRASDTKTDGASEPVSASKWIRPWQIAVEQLRGLSYTQSVAMHRKDRDILYGHVIRACEHAGELSKAQALRGELELDQHPAKRARR